MDEARERMLALFNRSMESNQPLSWFEELYQESDRDRGLIPWDWKEPHPFLVDWIENFEGNHGRALVVGCGLGEDAAFLSTRGWQVTAFDISESAVEWARKLHPQIPVEWVVEDLLNTPDSWHGKFDLVLEVHILQAIPREISKMASKRLSPLVATGGHLVCIGRIDDSEEEQTGPPWPLPIDYIEEIGTELESLGIFTAIIPDKESTRYRAVWKNSL
tara:strand:- start:18814 stop:19467 length:654 start_codon:yes stop_codon:yes gene_type:complete